MPGVRGCGPPAGLRVCTRRWMHRQRCWPLTRTGDTFSARNTIVLLDRLPPGIARCRCGCGSIPRLSCALPLRTPTPPPPPPPPALDVLDVTIGTSRGGRRFDNGRTLVTPTSPDCHRYSRTMNVQMKRFSCAQGSFLPALLSPRWAMVASAIVC